MNSAKIAIFNIITALIFAGAIIVSSWILQDSGKSQVVTYVIIFLWIIPSSFITAAIIKNKK